MKIKIEIKTREKYCDKECPMLMTFRYGTEYCCRIFSEEIPEKAGLVHGFFGIERHEKCLEAENG